MPREIFPCRLIRLGLLVSIVMISAVFGAFAQEERPLERHILPKSTMSLLVDPTRQLSLGDILAPESAARFRPIAGDSINLGFTTDAAWLRIEIEGMSEEAIWLALSPNFVDLLDIYVGVKAQDLAPDGFQHWAMGDNRPMTADAMSGLDNVVPLDLKAGQTSIVYIRAAAVNSNLSLTAILYSPINHTLRTTVSGLIYGMWFGAMAVLVVIQLIFYQFDRKPYYILLALATLVAMLVYTGILGLSRLFLFPGGGVGNDIFTATTSWFGLSASSLAAASILDLRRAAPFLHRLFLLGAFLGLVGCGFAASGANLKFAATGNFAIVALSSVAAFYALWTVNADGVGTRLRGAAFVALWLGLVATLAQRAAIMPLPTWVAHSYAVSCVVQTVLLTGALGVRLRAAEAKNRAMREEALAAAIAAEQRANMLVEEKTHELLHAKAMAEEALRAELASQEQQVRFMEVLGHQYRTPLATIRSHVDAMDVSLPARDSANRRRIERIRLGISRLVEVLEVNLARSRLQGSAFRPMLRRIAISELIDTAVSRARDLLQRDIEAVVPPEAGKAEVEADMDMLGIAIINLLENAAKFSALNEHGAIRLSCVMRDGAVVVCIEDQGIGIPPDEIAHITGSGVRGSNAVNIPGSGIGLSLVKRIAKAHAGSVEIASMAGVGTTVKIVLPIAAA